MSYESKDGFLAVCGSLLGLSTIAVGLRLVARKKQRLPYLADDAFAITALVMYLGAVVCMFRQVQMKTIGYSSSALTEAQLVAIAPLSTKYSLAWDVFINSTAATIKLSALFFYKRIFPIPGCRGRMYWTIIATVVIVLMWLLTYIVLPFRQCGTHISALWDGKLSQYCGIQTPFYLSLVISNFIMDLWILAMPIPSIVKLHISLSKKVSTIGVFLLAFIGLGASIGRLVIYVQIAQGGPGFFQRHDLGKNSTKIGYLTMLEAGISLIAVNLPSLWLLFTSFILDKTVHRLRTVLSGSSLRNNNSRKRAKHTEAAKGMDLGVCPSDSMMELHSMPPKLNTHGLDLYKPADSTPKDLEAFR